ncbi:DUF6443 domain-containing protein [Pinibacter aurantiacus]|uniref:DUF6443 domain-containing protein n=1 Tax=Pinibacter aurantiacus TaxID=2851599 RepID=A0A9E2SEG0_9BACT|nr:DUF6443 domain-containing protein [Pinibacter aurantiacus]MBV4360612.1 hypothetical protein [Pinibacter aurantiacus]
MKYFIILFLAFLAGPLFLSAQPGPYGTTIPINFIRTWTSQQPYKNTLDVVDINRKPNEVVQTTQYADGLGRPLQAVVKQGSQVTGNPAQDVVVPVCYDAFGKESLKYLPYVSTGTDGSLKHDPFTEQKSFYNTLLSGQGETFYYSQTNFEASPLNRVQKLLAPGNSWVGNDKGVEVKYWFNTTADSVRIWEVTNATNNTGTFGTYSGTNQYNANELFKNVTVDESGKQTITFKDKKGHVVLTKVQYTGTADEGAGINGHGWIYTYYIYDRLNNLRCIIQPEGVNALITSNYQLTTTILNEQCFRYEYDARNRMIMKKAPGAVEVYMIYDERERLVMTQDANMRKDSKWQAILYDVLNRPLLTGFINYTGSFASLQALVKTQTQTQTETPLQIQTGTTTVPVSADLVLNTPGVSGDKQATNSIVLDDNFTSADEFVAEIVAAGTVGSGGTTTAIKANISCNPLPPATTLDVLTQIHYDDYSELPTGLTASVLPYTNTGFIGSYNTAPDYAQEIKASDKTKGFVTWTRTRVLGTDQFISNANLYDDKGRLIQVQSLNATGGKDVVTAQYNWAGKPLRSLQKIDKGGANAQSIELLTTHAYDDLGRVASVKKKVTKAGVVDAEKIIVQNEYDALGQLKKETLAPEYNSNTGLESLTYDYNIRGWLLGANRDYIKNANSTANYFGYDLGYDKTNTIIPSESYTAQFNGNIAGTIWKTKGSGELRKYDFTYDAVSRLTGAAFGQYTGSNFDNNGKVNYSVSNLSYDANGNIITMNQMGLKGTSSDFIDKLAYHYIPGTNKLLEVIDAKNDANSSLGDFKYNAKSGKDYDYDDNGNLTQDLNKSINAKGIVYNHLNLPQKIKTAKGTVEYVYDAAGNKLKKIVTEGTMVKTTLYLDGAVFQNDTLQFIAHEEGRIRITRNPQLNTQNFTFDYFLRDYLGNVRMVLTDEQQTNGYNPITFEDANKTYEQNYYDKADVGVTARPPAFGDEATNGKQVQLLRKTTQSVGVGKLIKVMAGDKINAKVDYYTPDVVTDNSNANGLNSALGSLGNLIDNGAAGAVLKGTGTAITNGLTAAGFIGNLLNDQNNTNASENPKAYLNVLFFDEQFNYVSQNSGFSQIGVKGSKDQRVLSNKEAAKNGWAYVYVNNESNNLVYFDNFQVSQERGRILEENHYYPYGLTMAGISSKAASFGGAENKYKYNGIEQNNDFDINMYDAYYRSLDPQTGRFWQQDPRLGMSISSYAAMQDNPVFYADPLGDTVINGQKYEPTSFANATYLAGVTVTPTSSKKAELADYLSRVGTEIESMKCHIDGQREALKEQQRMLEVYSKLDFAHGQVMPPMSPFWGHFIQRTYGSHYVGTNGYLGGLVPTTGMPPAVGIAGGVNALGAVENLGEGEALFNFGGSAGRHMMEPGRTVPVQILEQAISGSEGLVDPKGSQALMHYIEMSKNGKLYNLEVLYDEPTNTIWHFKYTQDPIGPLKAIPK